MWAWDGILSGAEIGPPAHIINPWPKAQMDLDVRCRTIGPPLIRSWLPRTNQGAKEAAVSPRNPTGAFWAVTMVH